MGMSTRSRRQVLGRIDANCASTPVRSTQKASKSKTTSKPTVSISKNVKVAIRIAPATSTVRRSSSVHPIRFPAPTCGSKNFYKEPLLRKVVSESADRDPYAQQELENVDESLQIRTQISTDGIRRNARIEQLHHDQSDGRSPLTARSAGSGRRRSLRIEQRDFASFQCNSQPLRRSPNSGRRKSVRIEQQDLETSNKHSEEVSISNLGAECTPNTRVKGFVSAKNPFYGIMTSGKTISIDATQALSIDELRIRDICTWAVASIKRTLKGIGNGSSLVQGFVSTGKFSIVTKIPESFLHLVVRHFVEKGHSGEESHRLSITNTWYLVVEGGHIHRALVETIEEDHDQFGGFRWPVYLIEWQPPQVLKALARMSQEMQKETHMIEFTLPDIMQNLRNIADEHASMNAIPFRTGRAAPHGFIKNVVALYTGSDGTASSTLRTICSVVLKLSPAVINAIRKILTEEYGEYARSLGGKKPFNADTRVFKKLLSTQTLRGAKKFLDPQNTSDEDRIDVIHRLRYIAKVKEFFKAFSTTEVEQQTQKVLTARINVKKFRAILGNEGWPEELRHLLRNIMRTTLMDEEIENHGGKEKELLPSLVMAYVQATGPHGRQVMTQYKRQQEMEIESESRNTSAQSKGLDLSGHSSKYDDENLLSHGQEIDVDKHSPNRRASGVVEANSPALVQEALNSDAQIKKGSDQESDNILAKGTVEGLQTDAVEDENLIAEKGHSAKRKWLEELGIEVHQLSFGQYERNSVDLHDSFDLIICDPLQRRSGNQETLYMDDKDINDCAQFLRRVLVPGGYCLVFLNWKDLVQWASILSTNQMDVWSNLFRIIKDPTKFQRHRTNELQNMIDDVLVVRKPGTHPKSFSVDRSSPYIHISGCQFPRHFGAIDKVPPPTHKLTFKPGRSQVCPNERSPAVLEELLQTFCPASGKVLDPFAGVLTTGLACVVAGHSCVLLEQDERCLSEAFPRLEGLAMCKLNENIAQL